MFLPVCVVFFPIKFKTMFGEKLNFSLNFMQRGSKPKKWKFRMFYQLMIFRLGGFDYSI